MISLNAAREYIADLVHPSVAGDEIAAARHRGFIAAHLVGAIVAFAALPLVLLFRGVSSPIEIVALAWLVAPLVVAFDLSRSGRLDRAYMASVTSCIALVLMIAMVSGGIRSFALLWLPVICFEAAFSGSRRVIGVGLTLACLALLALVGLDLSGAVPREAASSSFLLFLSAAIAAIYAALVAMRWETLQARMRGMRLSHEQRYRLLAENMTDVISRHTRSGAVLFISPVAEKMLGVHVRELMGQGLFGLVHVADRPAFLTAISGAIGGTNSSVEFRVRNNSTSADAPHFLWIEMRCHAANRAGDEAVEIVGVMRDISERKAHEEELQAARAEADRANAAKSYFLATMSHELRTPLNAIIGFSELLASTEMQPVEPARRAEYAGLIHESGLHLLSVVNGVLDMSRIESGNFVLDPEPFDFAELIRGCTSLLSLKAEAGGIALVEEIERDLPEINADKRACKQILINLLSNGVKFTPAGGRVVVSGRCERGEIVLTVADTGVGVAEEDLPHLGDPFFQASASYGRNFEGTGLGLSVVKGLIGLHGGSFAVESALGAGTRVVVRLPLQPPSGGGSLESLDVRKSTPGLPIEQRMRIRA